MISRRPCIECAHIVLDPFYDFDIAAQHYMAKCGASQQKPEMRPEISPHAAFESNGKLCLTVKSGNFGFCGDFKENAELNPTTEGQG